MRRPATPQLDAANAGQGGERRRHGGKIIGVEDAAGSAEDDAVGERPDAPQRHRRASPPPAEDRAQQSQRQGPGELRGKRRSGEPQWSHGYGVVGFQTRHLHLCGRLRGQLRGRRPRRANEAFQTVMDHDQLEHGIVVAAAGIRPAVSRREVEGHSPGERHDPEGDAGCRHPGKPPAPIERTGEPPARQQGRTADERGQHLHIEGNAQQRHRRHQRKAAAAQRRRRRQQQEEDQPGVGVVGAIDRDGHGHHGQHQGG
jgi:hypothetical protein